MAEKDFSAGPSALGYLYQCRYALLAALRITEQAGVEISIEGLDDVAFERNAEPFALIQTKHHITRQGDLTDMSRDLWKTLRVWSELVRRNPEAPFRMRFFLISTTTASPASAASYLRADDRDVQRALTRLRTVAVQSENAETASSRQAFMALTETLQFALLEATTVLDGSAHAFDLQEEIARELRRAAPKEKLDALVQRLEGWWLAKVVELLTSPSLRTIRILEIESKIDELRESFRQDALPVDHRFDEPSPEVIAALDQRPFVRQLHLITASQRRVEFAVRDYYRASEQRSRWIREELLFDDELERYERLLMEEWERRFVLAREAVDDNADEATKIQCGRQLYEWVELTAEFPIRTLRERFLTIGSYHILSNQVRLGWHPDYVERIQASVKYRKESS